MPELLFSEAADSELFDKNMRLGSSGIHGEFVLDANELPQEMDRILILRWLVAHRRCEPYEVVLGNETPACEIGHT